MSDTWQVISDTPGECPMCKHGASTHTGPDDGGCAVRIGYSHMNGDEDCGCPLVRAALDGPR